MRYYVFVKSSFKHTREECESKRAYVFRNGSGGGLYRECTTTPGSPTVMNSTFSSSHTEMLFTFRPSLTKTELPCLLCGRSATSVIPGIFGLAWSLAQCVSWRH